MTKLYHFFSNRLALATAVIRFEGIANVYDDTMFLDRIQLLDEQGNLASPQLKNFDFTYPGGGNGYYAYLGGNTDPALGWKFVNGAGIATNGSAFDVPNTPDGNAVVFIQNSPSYIEQQISLRPGKYQMRFLSSQRFNQNQVVLLKINGVEVDRFQAPGGQGFIEMTSNKFEVK